MNRFFVRHRRAHLRAASSDGQSIDRKAAAAAIAAQLRAQIPGSTDPERLEKLAREAEVRAGISAD